ncbi:hypothetical protein [Schauerella aestuarii]|uniref:hypothetical protein n=1 Tax=Schauerella aestuarii TaxID=2511204 RepID=UPI0013703412|nr:hypothetical protein [Achromobacter aestuarii]MYZ42313.1 hypothetical protein [Achromobacter aestuarii]
MLHFNTLRVLTRMWLTVAGALTACSAFGAEPAAPAPPVDPLVRSRDAVVLSGSGHSWGFGALSPNAQTVFVARRENGLTVFDVVHQRAQPPIAGTEGANAVVTLRLREVRP